MRENRYGTSLSELVKIWNNWIVYFQTSLGFKQTVFPFGCLLFGAALGTVCVIVEKACGLIFFVRSKPEAKGIEVIVKEKLIQNQVKDILANLPRSQLDSFHHHLEKFGEQYSYN